MGEGSRERRLDGKKYGRQVARMLSNIFEKLLILKEGMMDWDAFPVGRVCHTPETIMAKVQRPALNLVTISVR